MAAFQNFLLKILALAIGSILWFFVVSSNNIELTKDVDLSLDLPPNHVISNEVTNKVTFRLLGSKFFLRTVLDSLDTIHIDLTRAKPGRAYYNITSDMLQLPIGVKVLSISPSRIYPEIELIKKKRVPLKMLTKNKIPNDMRLIKLETSTKTVSIKGPKSKIDEIKTLQTQIIDLSKISPELEWKVPVTISTPGVFFEEEESPPYVLIKVEPKGSNFRISGVSVEILGERKYTTTTKNIILFVRSPKKFIQLLKPTIVKASVDMKGLGPGKHIRDVKVKLPKGVKAVRIIPPKIMVEVE